MMPTRDGSLHDACCFKCGHHSPKGCLIGVPRIAGDVYQVCEAFELDRSRWHDLRTQAWEWRFLIRSRGGSKRTGQAQMKLEDWL